MFILLLCFWSFIYFLTLGATKLRDWLLKPFSSRSQPSAVVLDHWLQPKILGWESPSFVSRIEVLPPEQPAHTALLMCSVGQQLIGNAEVRSYPPPTYLIKIWFVKGPLWVLCSYFFGLSWDRVSLCSLGCPWIFHPPASTSQVLRL
jgi:hypothetical protein